MMTKQDLLKLYLEKYIAPDGGGRLEPEDDRHSFSNSEIRTTNNENPILFLVQAAREFLIHFDYCYTIFKDAYERHMRSTELVTGLHSRRDGDHFYISQSHDNIVAMMIGSFTFNSSYGEKIFHYGSKHGWVFNVKKIGDTETLTHQLQGGDIAICYFATNRVPTLWHTLWLGIGLAISKTWNLADLRIQFLKEIIYKIPVNHRLILETAIEIHKWRRGPIRGNWAKEYYKPEHPVRRMIACEYDE